MIWRHWKYLLWARWRPPTSRKAQHPVCDGERSQAHLTTLTQVCFLLPDNFQKGTRLGPDYPVAGQKRGRVGRSRYPLCCVTPQRLRERIACMSPRGSWCSRCCPVRWLQFPLHPALLLRRRGFLMRRQENGESAYRRGREFSDCIWPSLWQAQSPKSRGEKHIHVPEVKDHH